MPMPEYRRFICYFYEYTDGRKQRNAGFAKVELRDGVWRILLKINAGSCPESPIWVYGFVRETNRLRGVLLGEIRPVQQIAEEWAFRADAPIGEGSYVLGDLAGIWIESSDGRRFVTDRRRCLGLRPDRRQRLSLRPDWSLRPRLRRNPETEWKRNSRPSLSRRLAESLGVWESRQ